MRTIFLFQKIRTDLMNRTDSGDKKILVQFPGNSILNFFANFLKLRGRRQNAWVIDAYANAQKMGFRYSVSRKLVQV